MTTGAAPTHDDLIKVLHERPDECAYWTLSKGQRIGLAVLVLALAIFLVWRPLQTLLVINALCILFYLTHISFKFYVVWRSLERGAEVPVSADELAALRDDDLPTYSILVPLYHEASVVPGLIAGIESLDYPADKLDIQLLLEPHDEETLAACQLANLPSHFRVQVVPPGPPTTKPKACNYGLLSSQADYVVIYDAEDRPEPDQLKKAMAAFAKCPEQVVCLQAKLNYYNPHQNLLTRWFTVEYSSWFDLFLPGLTSMGSPIPLGGTSNHFKTSVLKALGGWDPFNVTEDCELGVRLHRRGYQTRMIDSTTWEEANSRALSWLRQRSRWAKGYLQTYLVYMRRPWRLLGQLGLKHFISFQMTVGGSTACFLLNPIYWLLTLLWLLTRWEAIALVFPLTIYALGAFCLYVGNFIFIYLAVAACLNRRDFGLVKYAILIPLYWLLMSIGAYKGVLQLLVRPHYWEKTDHGFFPPEEIAG